MFELPIPIDLNEKVTGLKIACVFTCSFTMIRYFSNCQRQATLHVETCSPLQPCYVVVGRRQLISDSTVTCIIYCWHPVFPSSHMIDWCVFPSLLLYRLSTQRCGWRGSENISKLATKVRSNRITLAFEITIKICFAASKLNDSNTINGVFLNNKKQTRCFTELPFEITHTLLVAYLSHFHFNYNADLSHLLQTQKIVACANCAFISTLI